MASGIKTGGRKKGSRNRITRELHSVINGVVQEEIVKMPDLLEKLDPKDRIDVLIKLLPYVLPKISPIQQKDEIEVSETSQSDFMTMVRKQYG